ncbi:hypothetical protein CUC08_Gglean011064 [Alternaria sp. MG1]|uniref:CFEM domain-containing protein n=1 Tax=Alternaria tenuissima TaxID=119927 RepID=A0AB37WGP4_9PLEO|nr:hypothetical protein B0T12DRAFT_483529 [Alternaria alternata]RII04812.1 hypothetical protein CUC08_Gglean011064 [Alternaria sp. MG1]RYN27610.1 hypothetical protein AA0115_g6284 [Alternaria tenuissima]OWY52557.1 hypothetical protein AALT_g2922 [Alternaria alternata]RYO01095.1 hypothetical protein AA0119_g5421 [Alternaria tenuissima]
MRFTQIATLLSVAAAASAQYTFNITQAEKPGNMEKYKCLDNKKLSSWMPECLHKCQDAANKDKANKAPKDKKCAEHDFACHCIDYSHYSALIEPCAFPADLGGKGTCSFEELSKARPIVQDMCNFFNATLYDAYDECEGMELSEDYTYEIISEEEVGEITY